MKLTHATWEKRNLDLECYELTVEHSDSVSEIENTLASLNAEYTVVKVPSGKMDAVFYLQQAGYLFIEMLTTCHHSPTLPQLPAPHQRMLTEVECQIMTPVEIDATYQSILDGLFKDDRISKDPCFTQEQANRRYVGWISDELEKNSLIYGLNYKGELAAFFTLKQNSEIDFLSFIGGVFPRFQRYGMGMLMNYLEIKTAAEKGAKIIRTAYSSNNRGASAVHLFLGYTLDQQYYVFVKHT